MGYEHLKIEQKWQKHWETHQTFKVEDTSEKPKYYVLDMFPYPSANGLHVGHLEGYTASDIVARYKRMAGFHVLHPMGWDSFGLPTENYAIQVKRHPADITKENIAQFKRQIKSVGFNYDWSREITTSNPDYYKWTQWLFLKLYEKGLAYEAEMTVNYCPELKIVLANEEVIDGKSERGNHPVTRVPMKQWVLKITAYADRLLEDLDDLDWPDHVKEMQRNWIGKSYGSRITFNLKSHPGLSTDVYTTRPDTLMGSTFLVLAAEHPLVDQVLDKATPEAKAIIQKIRNQSERERESDTKQKLGTPLPIEAEHPITGNPLPVWVANYVLLNYGTGAIMAVPAHDERDHEFAKSYDLPIIQVINEDGILHNSDQFDGLESKKAKQAITAELIKKNLGKQEVRYRLRDWIFSRQRYWGEPIPLLHFEDGTCRPLEADELPLTLPEVESYEPAGDGKSPLSTIPEWVHITDPKTKKQAERETHTMPQWAGSCWYYLRYIDPKNTEAPWDPKKEAYWLPVDLYIGGVEHATLHLLYARFWHKVFHDCGLVSSTEPFKKLVNQGMILGEDNEKMSKSRGNVVNPDIIVEEFGADSVRLYEMFMGPLEMVKPWNTRGILGVNRFLHRLYTIIEGTPHVLLHDDSAPTEAETKGLHKCIQKVTADIENFKFNTAISEMMSFINFLYEQKQAHKNTLSTFVTLLSPFAPHISEEIWEQLGHQPCLSLADWPVYNPEFIKEDLATIPVQVNGKLKGTVSADPNASKEDLLELVAQDERLAKWLTHEGRIKTIIVPNKIVNIVIKS